MQSPRSAGTFPRRRSWCCRPGAIPCSRLGALRAGGLALEIGPDDLRMDAGGGPPAPQRGRGWTCPDDEVAGLVERTEGWAAGLYLAALGIRARGVKAEGRRAPSPGATG